MINYLHNLNSGHQPQELADVVACNRNPATNMVEALDAWNIQGYGNNIDAIQDVQTFLGTYSGGRIRCRYSSHEYYYIKVTMSSYGICFFDVFIHAVLLRG